MSVTSNLLTWKASAVSALDGPDHQVTRAETAPARTAAASSSQLVLTASQRRLVMLWVQANWCVPVSSSLATAGAPPMPSAPAPAEPASPGDRGRLEWRSFREVRHTVVRVITAHLRDNATVSWQGMVEPG